MSGEDQELSRAPAICYNTHLIALCFSVGPQPSLHRVSGGVCPPWARLVNGGGHHNGASSDRPGGVPGKSEFLTPGSPSPLRVPFGDNPQPYVLGLTLFLAPLQVTKHISQSIGRVHRVHYLHFLGATKQENVPMKPLAPEEKWLSYNCNCLPSV